MYISALTELTLWKQHDVNWKGMNLESRILGAKLREIVISSSEK